MIDFQEKMEAQNNLWQDDDFKRPSKIRKAFKITSYLIIFVIIGFFIFSSTVLMSSQSSEGWLSGMSFWGTIKHLTTASDRGLEGNKEDRINILLLGMGGKNHDGGYLTDTIMLASLKPSTKEVFVMSLPRDLFIPWGDTWIKINNINAYAENREKGSGSQELSQALESLLDLNIHYYVRIDFDGFVKIIDELGGVEVNVENTLDDYKYPIRGQEDNPDYYARFEHLHIDKGWQEMGGSLALKYARSRHAQGIEGSDFARAKRQQKIIEAVKDKLFSSYNILKPGLLSRLISTVNNNLDTNLNIAEMIQLWNNFKDVDKENISNIVLDDGPNSYLVASRSEQGAYILLPKKGNYSEIKDLVNSPFLEENNETPNPNNNQDNSFPQAPTNNTDSSNNPDNQPLEKNFSSTSLEILNGTKISGLASETSQDLKEYGFTINKIANSPQANSEGTVVYDLTFGEKTEALTLLEDELKASSSVSLPDWLTDYIKESAQDNDNLKRPDFIIILGLQ
ncbi:MAG: LCP family protein [Candidatus Pacebacteria bacterium]|nr:LCP family protein [Candidatus Paceibacterota bacterium]